MTTDQDTLATLATVATEMEGLLLVNILKEHSIAAVATGGFTSQFQADAPGSVRVMVNHTSSSTKELSWSVSPWFHFSI